MYEPQSPAEFQRLLNASPFEAAVDFPFGTMSLEQLLNTPVLNTPHDSFLDSPTEGFDSFAGAASNAGFDFSLFGYPSVPSTGSTTQLTSQELNTALPNSPLLTLADLLPADAKVSIPLKDLQELLTAVNLRYVDIGNLHEQLAALSPTAATTTPASATPPQHLQQQEPRPVRRRATHASRLHECPEPDCGFATTRSFNLKTHMDTHATFRPRDFYCEETGCGKTFLRIHDLKRHQTKHNRDMWHFCKKCNRGFARVDALRRHEKVAAACPAAGFGDDELDA
ncbi:UNVERIFIED_CONTAM: hypothetical protein HDU68_008558 [Siphonaria sp. JEL0065]|nr:hypothetical protein HDU68_008558 [Siphonaria sp. JEL0065]